ncbi:tudor domain-containing protein 5 [Latimeria chalumnae]|uniref:tudor domain-containing protein 5 n=1 Tax=Latimeria chalumnae TaxID=7897 RepID=UPI00313CC124
MSSQEKLLKSLKKDIRSLLTSAKEGLTPLQLQREYSSMIGSPLPLCTLGYRTIMELILDMPDVVNVQYCADGSVVLTAIADETTKGIAGLVARQKSNPKAKSAMRRARVEFVSSQPFLPRRGKVPPVLPASAKCELKELLSDSPVLLSNFERAFLKRFGRAFQFMRYGFYSMLEVLSTISDIVEVQQTRAGSLLKLRTCLAPDKTKKGNPEPNKASKVVKLQNSAALERPKSDASPAPPTSKFQTASVSTGHNEVSSTPNQLKPDVAPDSPKPKKTSAGPSLQTALVSAEPNEVSLTPNQPNLDASRDSAEPKESSPGLPFKAILASPESKLEAFPTPSKPKLESTPNSTGPILGASPAPNKPTPEATPDSIRFKKISPELTPETAPSLQPFVSPDPQVVETSKPNPEAFLTPTSSKFKISLIFTGAKHQTSSDSTVLTSCPSGESLKLPLKPSDAATNFDSKLSAVSWNGTFKKLEEEIKAKLVEKGVGGTLDPELKEKIRFLAAQNPRGLLVSRLLTEFKAVFEEEVQLKELGFQSTVELVEALSDILWVLQPEGCQDCLVFDRETLQKKNLEKGSPSWGFSSSPDLSIQNYYSGWDFPLQDYTAKTENPWEQINTELKVITKPLEQVKELLLCPVTSESEIPPDAMREGFLCRVPEMEENTLVGVFVENVLSPIQFYVRFYSKDTSEMLEDLMIELRRCYSNEEVSERYLMPESYICPGQVCCVKAPGDVWWYRVIINQVLSKQEVEVYYADFGDLGTVDQSCLKFLKCCYSKLPAQAVPSSLAYIKPVKGVWSTAAITWFQTLCGSKPLVGLVSEYVKGVLYLFLCDTSTDDDVYIHDILIKQEHALLHHTNNSKDFEQYNLAAKYLKWRSVLEEEYNEPEAFGQTQDFLNGGQSERRDGPYSTPAVEKVDKEPVQRLEKNDTSAP